MNISDAITTVKNYVNSSEDEIFRILEESKGDGVDGYRPYATAALLISMRPNELIRVDSFAYRSNEDCIVNLLKFQQHLDKEITGIPDDLTIDNLFDSYMTFIPSPYQP
jgi:hypothetical protein